MRTHEQWASPLSCKRRAQADPGGWLGQGSPHSVPPRDNPLHLYQTECLLPLPWQGLGGSHPPLALLSPHLKAVRYSTSPMGGSTPPVHATFTLYPTPGPPPTWQRGGGGVILIAWGSQTLPPPSALIPALTPLTAALHGGAVGLCGPPTRSPDSPGNQPHHRPPGLPARSRSATSPRGPTFEPRTCTSSGAPEPGKKFPLS